MASQEEISLWIRLKDGITTGLNAIKTTGTGFASGMKTAMNTVANAFKSSMFSAVALGTAVSQMALRAISSIRQWMTDAKAQFQTFQESLTAVYTLLDKNTFDKFSKELEAGAIKIMQKYNFTIEDTNKALFDAVSAGIEAGNAVKFMENAARLAKGGVTTLGVAVDGMTSIINAYGLEQSEANRVADAFFTAQKFGKTTVEELASSIGKVAPIAKAAGMSYQEVLSALAQMTLAGISTDEAVTALKGTLTTIISPSEEAAKKFKELGIPMGGAAFAGEKFADTMDAIKNSTKGNIDEIATLIPNIRGLLGVTSVATKEGLQKYDDILKAVKTDHESLNVAFEKQSAILKEQIALEKGKLIPLKLQTGKILSTLELYYLKLGNAARETTNVYQQSFGVYGQVVKYLSTMAEKILIITGVKKEEASAEAEAAKKYIESLNERTIADREAMEFKLETKIEEQEKTLELDQEFIDRKAEMDATAEESRVEFENQKKLFDEMTAADRVKLLQETLGKEKILKATNEINELISKGKHEEAKKKIDKLYMDSFLKINEDTIKDFQDGYKKHWTYMLLGSKLNAEQRKDIDDQIGRSFQDLMVLMGEKSAAAFNAMKAVSIAQTIIKTYESAQMAFASLAAIPFVGPALGYAAAGVAVAAGLARVDMIRRQEPPKAESGAYVRRGGYAELHDQEMVLNRDQTAALTNGGNVSVKVYIAGSEIRPAIVEIEKEKYKMQEAGIL